MKYNAVQTIPGSAQRTGQRGQRLRGNCNRVANICTAVIADSGDESRRVEPENGWAEQRVTARVGLPVALRTGDKSRDGVIESEDRNLLARSVFAQATETFPRRRSEESRHEKGKDATKVRRQGRGRVQDGAAL